MYDFSAGSESVRVGLPPASLFRLPPHRAPDALPPPQLAEPTWYQPFNISASVYGKALDWRVPIVIASVYATTVVLLNRVNARRGFKPYAFSKTKAFKFFVIVHNVFLAIYSTWTFVGMLRAFRASWPRQDEPHGLTAVVDTMCRFNGPHGYGNAAMYDPDTLQWTNANPALLAQGAAPSDESGRMWNEGLAYLGWLFYLSKFYEVLDTAIILAKGKKSSTLQTYHHAGAMMCMWSGIRYMASPIWIFTQVNSGIHAMMYTYYTLSALNFRVPTSIKRSLTTMQILQFVFGSMLAASYLFVYYTIPFPRELQSLSGAAHVASSAVETGVATASAGKLFSGLKQIALRAVGSTATKNVDVQQPLGAGALNAVAEAHPVDVDYRMFTCLDTTGQAFGVWLNVMYLLPLTYLFVQFFIRSYLYRKDPGTQLPTPIHAAEKAGMDALKGVSREMHKTVSDMGDQRNGRA